MDNTFDAVVLHCVMCCVVCCVLRCVLCCTAMTEQAYLAQLRRRNSYVHICMLYRESNVHAAMRPSRTKMFDCACHEQKNHSVNGLARLSMVCATSHVLLSLCATSRVLFSV